MEIRRVHLVQPLAGPAADDAPRIGAPAVRQALVSPAGAARLSRRIEPVGDPGTVADGPRRPDGVPFPDPRLVSGSSTLPVGCQGDRPLAEAGPTRPPPDRRERRGCCLGP